MSIFREVKSEAKAITCPSLKETAVVATIVAVVLVISAGFFLCVDYLVLCIIEWYLNLN